MKAIDAEAAGKPGLALAVAEGSQGAVQYGEKGPGPHSRTRDRLSLLPSDKHP